MCTWAPNREGFKVSKKKKNENKSLIIYCKFRIAIYFQLATPLYPKVHALFQQEVYELVVIADSMIRKWCRLLKEEPKYTNHSTRMQTIQVKHITHTISNKEASSIFLQQVLKKAKIFWAFHFLEMFH